MTRPKHAHAPMFLDSSDVAKVEAMIRRGMSDKGIARYIGTTEKRISSVRARYSCYRKGDERIRGRNAEMLNPNAPSGLGEWIAFRDMARRGSSELLERWNAALIRNYGRGAA
jgi:hypothetical protein